MSNQNVGKMMMLNEAVSSPQLMGNCPHAQEELFHKSAMNISEETTASENNYVLKQREDF